LRQEGSPLNATERWREEHARLTQRVEELFRQATKRFTVPSVDGCRMVAFYLMALRNPASEKPARPSKAVSYGKLFLYHLAAERSQAEAWLDLFSRGQPAAYWARKQQEILSLIDEARQRVAALLPALSAEIDHRDPIRQIAAVAKKV
jgi:hypothetical protein